MSVSLEPDLCVAVVIQTENNVKGGSIYFGHFRNFSPLCPGWHNRIEKLSPQWAGKQRKGDYPSSTFFLCQGLLFRGGSQPKKWCCPIQNESSPSVGPLWKQIYKYTWRHVSHISLVDFKYSQADNKA